MSAQASPNLRRSLTLRLGAYGIAATAAAGAGVSGAMADVVYFNPADLTTPTTGANRLIYFTLSTGVAATAPQIDQTPYQFVLFGGTPGPPATLKASFFRNAQFPNNDGVSLRTAGNYIGRLAANVAIGPAGIFAAGPNTLAGYSSSTGKYGNWDTNTTGFLGLRFGLPDGQHYGWAQIAIDANYRVTLKDFAYESTAGTAIPAGLTASPVPEPATTSLLALALGAGGLGAYRARRRAAASAPAVA